MRDLRVMFDRRDVADAQATEVMCGPTIPSMLISVNMGLAFDV